MKSVCAKHEQAFELECPYCEKKAEGPTAAPAAPPRCTAIWDVAGNQLYGTACVALAAWRWTNGNTTAFHCDAHHTARDAMFPDWKKERLP